MDSLEFEVCVVGAGLAGMASATELVRRGASVAILSPAPAPGEFKPGESLAGAAVRILKDLGLDSLLLQNGHQPSPGNLSAWGTDQLVATDFIASPDGPGWHLDRAAFEESMFREVTKSGAAIFAGRFQQATRPNGKWVLEGYHLPITANWVLDATGRPARFARSQGAVRHDDNGQLAVIRWFRVDNSDTDSRTLVESVENGWWYTSLLPNQVRVVAFHGQGPRMSEMHRDAEAWTRALASTRHLRHRLGCATETANPKLVQACGSWLENAWGENWLAVGDAALAFDPISSQGMFSALYTGLRAAQTILGLAPVGQYADRLRSIRQAYLANVTRVYQAVNFHRRATENFRLASGPD